MSEIPKPTRTIRVDKASIDYQFGQIITRIDGQNGQLAKLTDNISELTERVSQLPCSNHNLRIESLEARGAKCKENEQWNTHNSLTFKQGLLIAIIGSAIGSSAAIVTMLLM